MSFGGSTDLSTKAPGVLGQVSSVAEMSLSPKETRKRLSEDASAGHIRAGTEAGRRPAGQMQLAGESSEGAGPGSVWSGGAGCQGSPPAGCVCSLRSDRERVHLLGGARRSCAERSGAGQRHGWAQLPQTQCARHALRPLEVSLQGCPQTPASGPDAGPSGFHARPLRWGCSQGRCYRHHHHRYHPCHQHHQRHLHTITIFILTTLTTILTITILTTTTTISTFVVTPPPPPPVTVRISQ